MPKYARIFSTFDGERRSLFVGLFEHFLINVFFFLLFHLTRERERGGESVCALTRVFAKARPYRDACQNKLLHFRFSNISISPKTNEVWWPEYDGRVRFVSPFFWIATNLLRIGHGPAQSIRPFSIVTDFNLIVNAFDCVRVRIHVHLSSM